MKKIILLSLFFSSFLFALSDAEIKHFYEQAFKKQIKDFKVTVLSREKIKNLDGFEVLTLRFESGKQKQDEIIFVKDSLIMPDIMNVKENTLSYRNIYEMKNMQEQKDVFAKKALKELESESLTLSLGDSSKPLLYVFTDPECPYCRIHLQDIENELKKYQIKLIFTPVHGLSAFEKSALIYKEAKPLKSDKEKLSILRKYYDEKMPQYNSRKDDGSKALVIDEKEVQKFINLYQKYGSLGLRAVPTIIEAK